MDSRWQETLSEARRGDEAAWTAIYRAHVGAMLGYARARGASEPEEVVAEAFEQAARDLYRFEGSERDLRAWLLRITHNRLIDEARRRTRRQAIHERSSAEDQALAQEGGNVEVEALAEIGAAEIRSLMSVLSDDQQAVILLRIMGGLSVGETAHALGKREGAVRALQHRAIATLEREIERRGPAYRDLLRDQS